MKHLKIFLTAAAFLVCMGSAASPQTEASPSFDLLFVNGQVMDGTGNPAFYADIGIKDGRITAVGKRLSRSDAARVVDIKGRIIAPGFIDIHTHAYDQVSSDKIWTGENERRFAAPNFVSQGVTTLVSNHCGTSPIPLKPQIAALTSKGTGPNVLPLIGHNSIRQKVMGREARRAATEEEITQMKALIREAMEDGAAGMSSGLEYVPAIWSTQEEVIALAGELIPYNGVFLAHERAAGLSPMWYVPSQDEPGPPNMLQNILDLIEVSKVTGVTVVAAHIKARGSDFWGGSRAIIRMIDDARDEGVDIWADCYPYNTSGSDGRVVLIPRWALGQKPQETLKEVLADPAKKRAIIGDIKHNFVWRGGPANIIVMEYPDESYIGKSLADIAKARGIAPVDLVIALQLEGFTDRPGGARLRSFSMSEIDVEAFSAQAWTATSSDASIALPGDGPVHARFYGTFPRKIRHYALERQVISLENAVRASTSLPAQIMGLRDRGMIREGLAADIVVFNPETIRDTATFFEPHQYADGIDFVMVNGTFVVEDGSLTWARPGKVLLRNQ